MVSVDYIPVMNTILNKFDKHIFDLEMTSQTNSQWMTHSQTEINGQPSSIPSSNRMKIHAYELAIVFEDAFDQLNIIHNALSITSFNQNNNNNNNSKFQFENIDSDDFRFSSSSIIFNDKKIQYFFHILILLFHALLFESQTDLETSILHIHNHLPSIQLNELNNRLNISQTKINELTSIRKHFQTDQSQQIKFQLTSHFMEEKYRSKIAQRYANDWKTNHIQQWLQMLSHMEENSLKTIHSYETILKQTEFVHQETIKIFIKQSNEMKFQSKKWYEHYQNETYRFERELIQFRHEFNQLKRQRQDMYDEYQRMKIIVDEYNQMKIHEKVLLEQQKQKEEAIKRIQAWWRGTTIRYFKQKRKKKKKK